MIFGVLVDRGRTDDDIGAAIRQPVPFSHKHHVGDVGLDCRFCHVTVETQASPGMPSAQLCLTCHSQLYADQPMLAPLRQAVASGQPIGWTHVYRLPDYVYFDHSVHVAKGVACIECHGRIDQMPLVAKQESLKMRWCIACHENPVPHLHRAGDIYSMAEGRLSESELHGLAQLMRIESRRRLTDCSTCHR
ncbi:MAG: cytochrome c3 family protein [Proteobacteria bacterium]|nr:cytochrome c3 family protein [Pseudomonadota bacterium]